MAARRVTAVTVPVDGRSCVAFESYPARTPLLTITTSRPALLVTLTLPEHVDPDMSGSPATSPHRLPGMPRKSSGPGAASRRCPHPSPRDVDGPGR